MVSEPGTAECPNPEVNVEIQRREQTKYDWCRKTGEAGALKREDDQSHERQKAKDSDHAYSIPRAQWL